MRSGQTPKLEELHLAPNKSLTGQYPGGGGGVAIMAGLEGEGCPPHLKELKRMEVDKGPQKSQTLGRALESGKLSCSKCRGLVVLEGLVDEAVREVMVVGVKGCHQLRGLRVDGEGRGMGRGAGRALIQPLGEAA